MLTVVDEGMLHLLDIPQFPAFCLVQITTHPTARERRDIDGCERENAYDPSVSSILDSSVIIGKYSSLAFASV